VGKAGGGEAWATGSAATVRAEMTEAAAKTVASNRRRNWRVLFTGAPFSVVMTVGEPSNHHVSEMIDSCDIAQAQGTNVGVKTTLKTRLKHQW
jgi:hypothetical protein